jgi:hypothetical protein
VLVYLPISFTTEERHSNEKADNKTCFRKWAFTSFTTHVFDCNFISLMCETIEMHTPGCVVNYCCELEHDTSLASNATDHGQTLTNACSYKLQEL